MSSASPFPEKKKDCHIHGVVWKLLVFIDEILALTGKGMAGIFKHLEECPLPPVPIYGNDQP